MRIRALSRGSFEKACHLVAIFCAVLFFSTSASAGPVEIGSGWDVSTSGATAAVTKGVPVGEPIFAANGGYYFSKRLFSLGGPMDFHVDLFYRSNHGGGFFPLPRGFLLNFFGFADAALSGTTLYATVWLGTGGQVAFKKNASDPSGNWVLTGPTETLWGLAFVDQRPQRKYAFKTTTGYAYLLDPVDERVYIFQKHQDVGGGQWLSRPVRIMDRNGNQLIYTYPSATADYSNRIEDGLGRFLNLVNTNVSSSEFLSTMTDQGMRQVKFNYVAQGEDNYDQPTLRSITDPINQITTFQYFEGAFWSNLIASQKLPRGNTPYTQQYESKAFYAGTDFFPRVTLQTDAYSNQTTLSYDSTDHVLDVTYPDSTTETYKHHSTYGFPEYIIDRADKTVQFTRNADEENITGMIDRIGDSTSIAYHAETGKLASITNARGNTTTYTYTAQDQSFTNPLFPSEQVSFRFYNLTRIDYPDATYEQFTYDTKGNMLTRRDRAGNTWTYTYNNRGQVLTITNPSGGVTSFTYNAADATLASRTDSDTGLTTYQYDLLKRVMRTNYPDGSNRRVSYNSNDQITQIIDQRGVIYSFSYDANGNLTQVVRASGTTASQTQNYQYDDLDRLMKFIDAQNEETQYAYTYWGGLKQITYPDSTLVSLQYDPRQWIRTITDEAGKTLQIERDDESVFRSFTTPQGRLISLVTNKLGFVTQITDPLSNTIRFDRDAMERIIKITDRLNREMTIGRDGEGRVSSVTLPLIGTTTYTRNSLGLVTQIRDQRNNAWNFTYTSMGRISQIKDPLNNTWTYTYNNMGLLSQITYPDGITETRTYDGNGSLTQRQFSNGLTLSYTYDELNRLTATGSVPVTVTYDNRDNITNTQMGEANLGATYDQRKRLQTVTYEGQMTVTYAYDARGLVTQVSDNLTGSWVHFTYGDDRLLIKIERSNNITTDIERNGNGRITRIRHGTKGEMTFTLDAGSQITKILENLPLDVASFLSQEIEQYSFDAANQITAAGFTYDARGRRISDPERTYTWDSADRLVGITSGSAQIAYEYTGRGEVAKRTVNGVTTEYFYNYAVLGHPIMAEKKSGGYIRFYVHTPDGRLVYFVDVPAVQAYFYHFNHIGTTLFLTNAAGNVTDTYGYTPYGRLMGQDGQSDQPFTFVGEHGVREEGVAGLYHMRARYYDSLTGRFLSRDPVWPDLTDPKSINPYQYVGQNPLSFIDPSGLSVWVGAYGIPLPLDPTVLPGFEGEAVGQMDDRGNITWGVIKNGKFVPKDEPHKYEATKTGQTGMLSNLMGNRQTYCLYTILSQNVGVGPYSPGTGLQTPPAVSIPPQAPIGGIATGMESLSCEQKEGQVAWDEIARMVLASCVYGSSPSQELIRVSLIERLPIPLMLALIITVGFWFSARTMFNRWMKRR